jgi:hypothetical protein
MARHFSRLNNPKAAKQEDIGLTNTFVAFTHSIGLSRFFSFIPPLFSGHQERPTDGGNKKDYKPHHKNLYK